MKSHCLPFSQIPHTTKLFTDFLSYTPSIRQFYPRSPHFREWVKEEAGALRYDASRRKQVAAVLERQNRGWGASEKTLENIARLRAGAAAAVTGQQVGLFGGPLFSLFKAMTAVKLAEDARAEGVDCVPIFWLATEDHDLAEVNHTFLPGADGAPQRVETPSHGVADAPVGTVSFGAEIEPVVASVTGLLSGSDVGSLLTDCYKAGESFGSAFARLFSGLFGDWGVILLDAADPELHRIAEPIYRAALERAPELEAALLARGRELEAAGYHQQVKVNLSSTLLFALRNGARVSVERASSDNPEFLIGETVVSRSLLLADLSAETGSYSARVLLRPVVQDYLLPTLAYTGGSAEVAYFAQVGAVYQALLGRVTPVIPRFSATLVESKVRSLLQRYQLTLPEVFGGPDRVRERVAGSMMANELKQAFQSAESSVKSSVESLRDALARLDKTLVDSATHASEKMLYQLEALRARAARAELRQGEILGRHAELLSNSLYPLKTLQEREIAGIYFVARHGLQLLASLYEAVTTDCLDHQILEL